MKEVVEFLKGCKTYYLATVENDQPRVRPFGTAHIFEEKLYIQTGIAKEVTKQILNNPKVEISGMYKGDWIRLEGELVLDERVEAQESMLDAYPTLRKMYTSGKDGNTAVFYFKNGKATIYSFTKEPHTITL